MRRYIATIVTGGLLTASVFGLWAGRAQAQSRMALEYQVKAAFLYNFARFVEWPTDAFAQTGNSIIVGLIGKDPFGMVLDEALRSKVVHQRKIVVRRFQRLEDVGECHVLFVSASEEPQLGNILKSVGGASILTVGDMDGFAERGGIIGFRKQDNKVRFEINADAAAHAGLKISSQLLKLAVKVIGPSTTELDNGHALP